MEIKFVRTTTKYIEELIHNIHPDIKKEVEDLSINTFDKSIEKTINGADESWTILADGVVLGIFGINRLNLLSDKGMPWLLTTIKIKKHVKTLLPLTKIALDYWLKHYNILENYIPENYKAAIRWVKWAGFTVYPPQINIFTGKLVHKIEMRV